MKVTSKLSASGGSNGGSGGGSGSGGNRARNGSGANGAVGVGSWLQLAFWKKPLHFVEDESHGDRSTTPQAVQATPLGDPLQAPQSCRSTKSPLKSAAAPPHGNPHQDSSHPDHHPAEMERTLGLFDLTMIGIGGTVGSGVFATAGLIASVYAGPAATLSWLIAGLGCVLSGMSFMELSCLIPSAGSTYAYSYHALGELPALFAGFLLTLEYGISSAGAARSWSDKFTEWMDAHFEYTGPTWMKSKDSVVDLYAGLLMLVSVLVVLAGMQAGKTLINVVTMTKISVVLFIIVFGLYHFNWANLMPFVPPMTTNESGQNVFGWPGVFLGASASFFGYIGYDEVCCLAGEAKNPTYSIPRAVLLTILGAAFLSTMATLSLVSMQHYTQIDAKESYGHAFEFVGWNWAASIVSTGEVVTMPIAAFIGFLAQPRVQMAMAKDGLLPPVFAQVDQHGNLFYGTLISGVALIVIAVFVPFHVLWDFISLGILVAFNLTNACLLFVRATKPRHVVGASGSGRMGGATATGVLKGAAKKSGLESDVGDAGVVSLASVTLAPLHRPMSNSSATTASSPASLVASASSGTAPRGGPGVKAKPNPATPSSASSSSSFWASHQESLAPTVIGGYLLTSFLAAFHWQKAVVGVTSESSEYMRRLGPGVAYALSLVAFVLMIVLKLLEPDRSAGRQKTSSAQSQSKMASGWMCHMENGRLGRLCCRGRGTRLKGKSMVVQTDESMDHEENDDMALHRGETSDGVHPAVDPLGLQQSDRNDQPHAVDNDDDDDDDDDNGKRDDAMAFQAPMVPFFPCVAIFFNWFLFAQMELLAVLLICMWLGLALLLYALYGIKHSLASRQLNYHHVLEDDQ